MLNLIRNSRPCSHHSNKEKMSTDDDTSDDRVYFAWNSTGKTRNPTQALLDRSAQNEHKVILFVILGPACLSDLLVLLFCKTGLHSLGRRLQKSLFIRPVGGTMEGWYPAHGSSLPQAWHPGPHLKPPRTRPPSCPWLWWAPVWSSRTSSACAPSPSCPHRAERGRCSACPPQTWSGGNNWAEPSSFQQNSAFQ